MYLIIYSLKFITRLNILQQNSDVVVSVGACLLMVKSKSMEQLVLDGAVIQASSASQRNHLLTTTTTNIGVASE